VRKSLDQINGARIERPAEEAYGGNDPAVEVETIWSPEPSESESNGMKQDLIPDDNDVDSQLPGVEEVPEPELIIEIGSDNDDTIPALGGTEKEKIQRSVMVNGTDALGWYVSFHIRNLQWGVYVPTSSLVFFAMEVFVNPSVDFRARMHLAFHSILQHELFHFATDYMIAQLEISHQEAIWAPRKMSQITKSPFYSEQEEKLANAHMIKGMQSGKPALRSIRGKASALRRFIIDQPPGYRDAVNFRRSHWPSELRELTLEIARHSESLKKNSLLRTRSNGFDFGALYPIRPKIDWRFCPIHLVHDEERLGIPRVWLDLFTRLVKIEETSAFTSALRRLPPAIQQKWEKLKVRLGDGITPGADFKKWPKGGKDVWSLRVSRSHRVHLRRDRRSQDWSAIEIGAHKEMGHG
jgi:hypothetical protein